MTNDSEMLFGVFPNKELAEGAIEELGRAGYSQNDIGIMTPAGKIDHSKPPMVQADDAAATGAVAGALTGGSLGVLAGAIAVAAFPGIGLAVTGGILTFLATTTAAGAALGVYAGPFVAMGLSKKQSEHYTSQIVAGRTLVVVKVADRELHNEVVTLLCSHGATEVRNRNGDVLAPMVLIAGAN